MRDKSILLLGGLILASSLLGCSKGNEGLTFASRDIPTPEWLVEQKTALCVASGTNPLADGLDDAKAPNVVTSGDAPCSTTSDFAGGGAVFDFSGDGLPDIIWTASTLGSAVFLENSGSMTFADVSDRVAPGVDLTYTNGVAIGDVDRDGDADMFMTASGRKNPVLLVNNGDGTFADGTAASGIGDAFTVAVNGTSAVFGDYDNDGWLDLYTMESRFVELDNRGTPGGTRLFRNLGGEDRPGVFADVTEAAGVAMRQKNGSLLTLTGAFHDIDDDGHLDLLVVSDFNTSRIFLNNGDGTFRDGFDKFPITDDESGMGLAIGDLDSDGAAEVLIVGASQTPAPVGELRTCTEVDDARRFGRDGSTGNGLFAFSDNGVKELTDAYGVRHSGWGWGGIMTDLDLDSRLDVITVGSYNAGLRSVKSYCSYTGSDQAVVRLWHNTGTSTIEVSADAGLPVTGRLKTPLAADLDLDGDEDLVILRAGDQPLLFENKLASTPHLRVSFSGEEISVNARITVNFTDGSDPLVRWAGTQNGLFSARHADEIIGLGERSKVSSVVVEYRSGRLVTIKSPRSGDRLDLP